MKSMAGAILKIISIFGYLPLTTIIGLSCLNFVSFLDWTGLDWTGLEAVGEL
jgi:hypothetical protein